jgi:hypothetical protein
MPRRLFIPLIIFNIPVLIILYTNGLWIGYILFSIGLTILFLILSNLKAFKGADTKILLCIAWFCPVNMLSPTNDSFQIQHSFQIQFVAFLATCAVIWMIYVYFYNKKHNPSIKSLWKKFNDYPNGSPWMIPIASAFILTILFG